MAERRKKPLIGSLQVDVQPLLDLNSLTAADYAPATKEDKESVTQNRKSVSYWHDAWRRLRRNTVAMVAMGVVILLILFAFVGPMIVPYGYDEYNAQAQNLFPWHYSLADEERLAEASATQSGSVDERIAAALTKAEAEAKAAGKKFGPTDKAIVRAKIKAAGGSGKADENALRKELGIRKQLFGYSTTELRRIEAGEGVFPHVFGTDNNGRDILVRAMFGTRVSMTIGVCAALMVLVIGSLYGSISGYCGGMVDSVMQRIVDIIYSIPEVLVILLLSTTLGPHISNYISANPGGLSSFMLTVGPNLISMFIAFGILYWVGMSRIIRGQVLQLKGQEYVTAARALGASSGRIIRRHLLPNCIGQIVVTTCLQIPSAIFLESFMSYLGVGVSAPLTSLGSMCRDALNGFSTYTYRLLIPAAIISIMILALNLFGDGLRDALDPKLKK